MRLSDPQRDDGVDPRLAAVLDAPDHVEPVSAYELWCPRCGETNRDRRALCRRPECPKKEENRAA